MPPSVRDPPLPGKGRTQGLFHRKKSGLSIGKIIRQGACSAKGALTRIREPNIIRALIGSKDSGMKQGGERQ